MTQFAPPALLEVAPAAPAGALPPRCAVADRLRFEWYEAVGGFREYALAELRLHRSKCLRCLHRRDMLERLAAVAVHPVLTAEEIERA